MSPLTLSVPFRALSCAVCESVRDGMVQVDPARSRRYCPEVSAGPAASVAQAMGVRAGVAAVPVPDRVTLCGLPDALSATVSDPASVPAVAGAKITWTVQFALAATLEGQLFVSAKLPVVARVEIDRAALPVLVTTTGWAVLVVPAV